MSRPWRHLQIATQAVVVHGPEARDQFVSIRSQPAGEQLVSLSFQGEGLLVVLHAGPPGWSATCSGQKKRRRITRWSEPQRSAAPLMNAISHNVACIATPSFAFLSVRFVRISQAPDVADVILVENGGRVGLGNVIGKGAGADGVASRHSTV